jgi:hypothetical protein
MDRTTGRPNHIQDVLVKMHKGQWFGFDPWDNQVYANLVIHDGSKSKPSESELTTELASMQAAFDAAEYKRKREAEYPSVQEQLDMLYHDQVDSTTTFKTAIKTVKDKYPKP